MTAAPGLPARLTYCEVFLRDGIQGWPQFLATGDKVRLVRAIAAAGVGDPGAPSATATPHALVHVAGAPLPLLRRLELRLLRVPMVHRSVNQLRVNAGKPPLQLPDDVDVPT